jgi:hypothetical protein
MNQFNNLVEKTLKKLNTYCENNKCFSHKNILFESPLYWDAPFFSQLNDVEENNKWAKQRIADSQKLGELNVQNQKLTIYQNSEDDYIFDFFINEKPDFELINAFFKYKINENEMWLNGVWQINTTVALVRNIIKKYYSNFFEYIISGPVSNQLGKRFWQNLAEEYIKKGKDVFVIENGKETSYNIKDKENYWSSTKNVLATEKRIKIKL